MFLPRHINSFLSLVVERYVDLDHLTRDMVETLIDHIEVGKRIPGTKNVPIEIHWNF